MIFRAPSLLAAGGQVQPVCTEGRGSRRQAPPTPLQLQILPFQASVNVRHPREGVYRFRLGP